jgi:shikimate 5-dehydrogenase
VAKTYAPGEPMEPASRPTLYFVGVTTGKSSIRTVFPKWADELGIEAELVGIDLPVHAEGDAYRSVTSFIRHDPESRGALVTTHKLDLFAECKDLFDTIDPLATLMHEVSCLSKRGDDFICHAKDPISSGLALDAFVPVGHFADTQSDLFIMGAGGSAIAIIWHLTREARGGDIPRKIMVANRSEPRLRELRAVFPELGDRLVTVTTPDPRDCDALLSQLPPHSLTINATGLGKDAPGSPLTSAATFPESGLVWDLNYRGDLVFLDQARAQEASRNLHVEDGWTYFLHGWTQVISEVFDVSIPTSGTSFERLGLLAKQAR